MRLRDDHIRRQCVQHVGVDAIDRHLFLHQRLDTLIDLAARAVHVEARRRAHRQPRDARRIIALMRARDEIAFAPERAHDLGRTGDHRHNARHALLLGIG
jgi:hypothetical protein